MIRRRAGWVFLGCGVLWLVLCLIFEMSTGLLGASNLPGSPSASATPSGALLQASPDELWRMYNAIEKDEGYLQIIFVAFPALITLAVFITPFMLGTFVNSRVNTAIDQRVAEATNALTQAQADYSAKSREFTLRIEEVRALLLARLAYLHWNLEDNDFAVNYANSAADTARIALESEPDNERMRAFKKDVDDSLAYYIAEAAELQTQSGALTDAAKSRGLEMLERVTAPGHDGLDCETVDTCLFVLWAFRDSLSASALQRCAELYRDWAGALASHRWKRRQRGNYEKYRDYYRERLAAARQR